MTAKQLSVFIENRSGRLSKVLGVLKENGVNILSLSLADTTEFGLLRLIVDNAALGKEKLTENGFLLTDRLDPTNSVAKVYVDYGEPSVAQTPNIFKYPENLHFVLGGVGKSTDTGYFGLIDELRISDGALTPSQFLRVEKIPGLMMIFK